MQNCGVFRDALAVQVVAGVLGDLGAEEPGVYFKTGKGLDEDGADALVCKCHHAYVLRHPDTFGEKRHQAPCREEVVVGEYEQLGQPAAALLAESFREGLQPGPLHDFIAAFSGCTIDAPLFGGDARLGE